ncbi:hypothetical protein EZY14_007400 [Kordia sp. TARA_039_SRF]|nr:hypothetical protein EZY14_007400 [Kordia sp. TARA_039_SRF]
MDLTTLKYSDFLIYKKFTKSCTPDIEVGDQLFKSLNEYCPIDGSKMRMLWYHNEQIWDHIYMDHSDTGIWVTINDCPNCGWWQVLSHEKWRPIMSFSEHRGTEDHLLSSTLKNLEDCDEDAMNSLRDYLYHNEKKIRLMNPFKFEKLVASVLKDFFSCEVKHVGQSRDGGIDLLIIDNGNISAVQVKRRSKGITERPSVVRELVGAMIPKNLKNGKVITTATKFGNSSHEYIQEVKKEKFQIELINCDTFVSMLKCTHSNKLRPWTLALESSDLKIGGIAMIKLSELINNKLVSPNITDEDLKNK